MATLILTSVGTLIGGPIGGALGAMLGQGIDARLFAPSGRKGPRLGDLSIQTSSYGSPIPRMFGTMRVAGTVIWSTDLKEDRHRQGGGKGRPKTTSYSYSASFAVALSGRPIERVGRIWADGKLLRGAAGDLKTETRFRLHRGGEDQAPDPLIAASEGMASTPAYRGTAYAVFEDFQLGEYGNRIPSLTFEVVADSTAVSTSALIETVSDGLVRGETGGATLTGYAAYGDSVRSVIESIAAAVPMLIYDDGEAIAIGPRSEPTRRIAPKEAVGKRSANRIAAGSIPESVEIGYYEPERDYQAGLQRARTAGVGNGGGKTERIALPAAIEAAGAKALAAAKLAHAWRSRERRTLVLPWRRIDLLPGTPVRLDDEPGSWVVAGWTFERSGVRIALQAMPPGSPGAIAAAPGRAVHAPDRMIGPTRIHLFDAPALGDEIATAPRLLLAAAGVEPGWRGAALETSHDGGASWHDAGATAPTAILGAAAGAVGPAGSTLFDDVNSVEIVLLNAEMWIESRDDDALVDGANLAMLGDELVQFGDAEWVSPRRFRLSRLLRGRRGSEWATGGHVAGEPFTLLAASDLAVLAAAPASVGAVADVVARGTGDVDGPAEASAVVGVEAVRPPSPVHLRAERGPDGAVTFNWTRRSRAGWAWIDGVDAPIGEASEAYRIGIAASRGQRVVETSAPTYRYEVAEQQADGVGAGSLLSLRVVQVGTLAPSREATISITI